MFCPVGEEMQATDMMSHPVKVMLHILCTTYDQKESALSDEHTEFRRGMLGHTEFRRGMLGHTEFRRGMLGHTEFRRGMLG